MKNRESDLRGPGPPLYPPRPILIPPCVSRGGGVNIDPGWRRDKKEREKKRKKETKDRRAAPLVSNLTPPKQVTQPYERKKAEG